MIAAVSPLIPPGNHLGRLLVLGQEPVGEPDRLQALSLRRLPSQTGCQTLKNNKQGKAQDRRGYQDFQETEAGGGGRRLMRVI